MLSVAWLLLVGCPKPAPVPMPDAAPRDLPAAPPPRDDVQAVVWIQTSAEVDALTRTVYRAARHSLDLALDDPTWTAAVEQTGPLDGLTPAIVVDVDETVLDNSPYQARGVLDGTHFEKVSWGAWVAESQAPAVAGAAGADRAATTGVGSGPDVATPSASSAAVGLGRSSDGAATAMRGRGLPAPRMVVSVRTMRSSTRSALIWPATSRSGRWLVTRAFHNSSSTLNSDPSVSAPIIALMKPISSTKSGLARRMDRLLKGVKQAAFAPPFALIFRATPKF